jgi:hypothetical protein
MNRAAKCLCVVAASLLAAAHPTGQQADDAAARWRNQFLQGGELTLTQDYGRAMYARCVLTAVYFQPPLPGTDRLELRCTPNVRPLIDDVFATRMLSADEVSAIAKVAGASDLYSGGHAGNFGAAPGSEGPVRATRGRALLRKRRQSRANRDGEPHVRKRKQTRPVGPASQVAGTADDTAPEPVSLTRPSPSVRTADKPARA